MKQPLSKSTNSLASDSSSGILSTDGQLHGNDQHSHKEYIAERTQIDTSSTIESLNLDKNSAFEQDTIKQLSEINIHSGDNGNDSLIKSQSTDDTLITSTPEKLKKENSSSDDLSEVTRHLLSVRHPSGLGRYVYEEFCVAKSG